MSNPRVHDFIDMLLRGLASLSPVPMPNYFPEEPELEPGVEDRLLNAPSLLSKEQQSD